MSFASLQTTIINSFFLQYNKYVCSNVLRLSKCIASVKIITVTSIRIRHSCHIFRHSKNLIRGEVYFRLYNDFHFHFLIFIKIIIYNFFINIASGNIDKNLLERMNTKLDTLLSNLKSLKKKINILKENDKHNIDEKFTN